MILDSFAEFQNHANIIPKQSNDISESYHLKAMLMGYDR